LALNLGTYMALNLPPSLNTTYVLLGSRFPYCPIRAAEKVKK